MDFCRTIYTDTVVGCGMAAALVFGRDCDCDVATPCSDVGLRSYSWPARARCIWPESAEPAARDTRANGYAAHADNFSDRLADLAKDPSGKGVGITGPGFA